MGRSSRGCVAALWLLAACQVWCISAQTLNNGNLAVSWDVVKSSTQEYTVVVRLRNNQLINPIPAPGWLLSWTWMMSEMVETVDGAQVLNLADCSGTDAALDFPNEVQYAVTCAPRPIFVSTVNQGYLPATSVDAVNNTAQFTITMGKGSLFWGIGNLTLPTNFDVGLPGYQCTLPAPVAAGRSVPVSMTGRQYYTAISSYDFTCAPSAQSAAKPKCCVSFSGFFNNTVATCPSCACGCNATLGSNASSCPATWQSGPNAATQLVLGPAVRTTAPLATNSKQTLDASPLPCGSGCQTDIHFAISEEYEGGWKVQVAIANTGSLPINNWLLAMDLPLINYLGSVYSVNYATSKQLPTFAIFSGQPFFNEVINASPGSMQWIMLFNKTAVAQTSSFSSAPVVKVVDQNAFPTSVYFMGQQCSMPPLRAIPSNLAGQTSGAFEGVRLSLGLLLGALALAFVL